MHGCDMPVFGSHNLKIAEKTRLVGEWRTSCGVAIVWRRAWPDRVPIAKTPSWPPHLCRQRQELHTNDPGLQLLGLGLHPAHRQLAGVIQRLGELRISTFLPDVAIVCQNL